MKIPDGCNFMGPWATNRFSEIIIYEIQEPVDLWRSTFFHFGMTFFEEQLYLKFGFLSGGVILSTAGLTEEGEKDLFPGRNKVP